MLPLAFPREWKTQFLFLLIMALTFWWEMNILLLRNTKQKTVWNDFRVKGITNDHSLVGNPFLEILSRSNPCKWLFHFLLPVQLWGLTTHLTCKIFSNGSFVLCTWNATLSFLIKISVPGATEIEFALFHSFGNNKGGRMDNFFWAQNICHSFTTNDN